MAYWNDVPIGVMVIEIAETSDDYKVRAEIDSLGLAKAISRFYSRTSTKGDIRAGKYIQNEYRTAFNLRKRLKNLLITYSKDGKVKSDIMTPPDNPKKRPPVNLEMKHNTLEPLTAILYARKYIKEGKEKFSLPLYDGRRRFDLNFTSKGIKNLSIAGNTANFISYEMIRDEIAGFTENEKARAITEDPVVRIYIANDNQFIPYYVEGTAIAGRAHAILQRTCATFSECSKVE